MDVSKMLESDFLTVQLIKDSPTKKGVILSSGTEETTKGPTGEYKTVQVLVELDGKRKNWKMNKASLKNIASKLGTNTDLWVGKQVQFTTMMMQGGKEVLGESLG